MIMDFTQFLYKVIVALVSSKTATDLNRFRSRDPFEVNIYSDLMFFPFIFQIPSSSAGYIPYLSIYWHGPVQTVDKKQ